VTTNRPSDRGPSRPSGADPAARGAHAGHDALLIARLAGNDVSGADEARARDLVASCAECAALLADLAAISAALPGVLRVPRRRRDFRLTPNDAARLRGSRLTRWLDRANRQRILLLQPLAGATVALGLAMALLSAPGILPMASSAGGYAAAPIEPVYTEMAGPIAAAGANDGSGGVQKGDSEQAPDASPPMLALPSPADDGNQGPVTAGTPEETPIAGGDGRSQVTTSGEPGTSEAPPLLGAAADAQLPGAGEIAGAEAATTRDSSGSIEAWAVWLLVAAAGGVVLVAVTAATSRRTSAG
jgi:hypothetical protein